MNKTPQDETQNSSSSATHQTVQKSSTLSRRYVKRPTHLIDSNSEAEAAAEQRKEQRAANLKRRQALAEQMNRQNLANLRKHHAQKTIAQPTPVTPESIPTPEPEMPATKTTRPAKAQQSVQAQQSAAPTQPTTAAVKAAKAAAKAPKTKTAKTTTPVKSAGRARRFIIAFTCSAACVAALALLVHLNMPDLSVKVAAMQTGIEAAYPSYIPRDYQLSGVSTDKDGRVIMEFSGPDSANFTLTEEKSTWDSTALLNNYVKKAYGEEYTTLREQGITLYIGNTESVWVNGGMLYRLTPQNVILTKKQIKNIATSL